MSLAKRLLSSIVANLPWGARRAVLDGLQRGMGVYELLVEAGSSAGVRAIVVHGRNGDYLGDLIDVDGPTGRYLVEGEWSWRTVDAFRELLKDGGTYIDIGANVGLTLAPIAQITGTHCYGFEPIPRIAQYLRYNVAVNAPNSEVTIHEVALSDINGTAEAELSATNSGNSRLAGSMSAGDKITVKTRRLDEIVHDIRRPLGVKIDVEGAEPLVFRGGEHTLRQADLLSVEFHPYQMRQVECDPSDEIKFLEKHFREGKVAAGDSGKDGEWQPASDIAAILMQYWESKNAVTDYLDVTFRR